MKTISISLPYTPYAVPIGSGRTTVNLTGNALQRLPFATSRLNTFAVTTAKRQMKRDAFLLARAAGAPPAGAVRFLVTVRSPRLVRRDQDNAIAGLKAALDGIAEAWKRNDASFHVTEVRFERGKAETLLEALG